MGILLGTMHSWCTTIAMPAAIVPLYFSFISLPLEMLIAESIALSNILSKSEALLQEEAFDMTVDSNTSGNASKVTYSATSKRALHKSDGSMHINKKIIADKRDQDDMKDLEKSSSDGDFDDEDEDLDRRALENSEEASHRIQFRRQLKYAL